jgi:Pyruvate/2-oxoacid:ferredoxin oxidoreductase delta subunit
MNARMINIDRFKKYQDPGMPAGKTLVGFSFPTHGFNAAPIMVNFILRYPRKAADSVFLMNTRAGMKLGRFFLPGLSGIALLFPALILLWKGYSIKAFRPVDLPSNWISLHPGLKGKVVISIYERWKRKIGIFSDRLLSGKKTLYPLFRDLPWDLVIMPVSIGYYFFGRYMLAKTFIATSDCTSCKQCANRCPTNSIKMLGDRPYWKFTCESCMRCMNICPHNAIETTHTITGIFWYICWSTIPSVAVFLLVSYGVLDSAVDSWVFKVAYYMVMVPISFLFIGLAYRSLHYLMRFRIVNKLITATSFTSYKFWRRYKPQKLLKSINITE